MIALEYISHGLKQKYSGYCGTVLFLMGCTAYFFVVTGLNHYTSFEGALGIGYGVVLYVYCLLAAEGRKSDFFLLSVVWVLLAFISAYVMFAVWGMFSGGSLEELLKTESQAHMYFSLSAGALRFSMGRIVLAVYQRRKQKKILAEDWLMAVTFLIFFFLILCMFRLECGGLGQKERYHLSLWILFGIFLAIILLGGFYQLIGKYRIEKIEDEYQKENQKLQEEQIHNLFQLGREANRLRHDMSAKVNVVYGLLRKQAYKEAEESLKRIADEWEDYLEIPEEIKKTIKQLSCHVNKENSILYNIEEIQKFLKNNYQYTYRPGLTGQDKDPVNEFLTERKRGFCTQFASAAVFLFREAGIPARYVEGYKIRADQWRLGKAQVTDYEAHAWTEIYIEHIGWIPVEVTGRDTGESVYKHVEQEEKQRNAIVPNKKQFVTNVKKIFQMIPIVIILAVIFAFIKLLQKKRKWNQMTNKEKVLFYEKQLEKYAENGAKSRNNSNSMTSEIIEKARYSNKDITRHELNLVKRHLDLLKRKNRNVTKILSKLK